MKYCYTLMLGIFALGTAVAQTAQDLSEDKAIKQKMAHGERLVNDAITFFEESSLGEAMRAFEKDERFRHGEFEINVFDSDGNCYLFGTLLQDIWANFADVNKSRKLRGVRGLTGGASFIKEMVAKGDAGGDWMSFDWLYETYFCYVRTAVKDGTKYVLFAGMYPESLRFQVRELISSAIRFAGEHSAQTLFAQINNPAGEFVRGDSYLWAYDMEGNCFAHGRNLALVGQNLINFQDSAGNYRNKVMIDLVKKRGSGWIEYQEDGVPKYAFVQGFKESRTGKEYIIGGGYYPNITDESVVAFVKRAIEYLKANGATVALRDFTSHAGGFIKGPLRVSVINMDGVVLADAENPVFIGQNLSNSRDPEGRYVIKDMIAMAKEKGRGWITYVESGAYKSIYLEYVETPEGKYIVSSGFWPSSKQTAAGALVEKAALQLINNGTVESLRMFTTMNSEFLRGDLFVEVYTDDGICLAYGLDRDRIWHDEKTILDEKGVPLIDRVLDVAKRGGGWTEYTLHGATRKVYAKQVVKEVVRHVEIESTLVEPDVTKKTGRVVKKEAKKKSTTKQTFTVAVGYFV